MATIMRSSADASATPSRWQDSQQQLLHPRQMQGVVQAGWVATKKRRETRIGTRISNANGERETEIGIGIILAAVL